jgi:hypothetical protein
MDKATYLKMKDRAEILRVASPDKEDYIWGYLRGLARAHHGDAYGQGDHKRLSSYAALDPALPGNEENSRIGAGYLDGLKAKPIGHGGPGRRTAVDGAAGLVRKNVMLDQPSIDVMKNIGDGDLSLGIRRAATKVNHD